MSPVISIRAAASRHWISILSSPDIWVFTWWAHSGRHSERCCRSSHPRLEPVGSSTRLQCDTNFAGEREREDAEQKSEGWNDQRQERRYNSVLRMEDVWRVKYFQYSWRAELSASTATFRLLNHEYVTVTFLSVLCNRLQSFCCCCCVMEDGKKWL